MYCVDIMYVLLIYSFIADLLIVISIAVYIWCMVWIEEGAAAAVKKRFKQKETVWY